MNCWENWMSEKKHKCYLDYFSNEEIKCPYCDHEFEWDYEGESDFDTECDACEKKIFVETNHSITYTTRGECDVHKLWRYGGEENGKHSYTCQVCANEYYDFHFERLGKEHYEILPAEWELSQLDSTTENPKEGE